MTRKLGETLSSLGDTGPEINLSLLANLSDLNSRELARFRTAWITYDSTRRVELLHALIELAVEHVEYDFRVIYSWALGDANPRVRSLSIEGLWEDERPHLIAAFRDLLHGDSDPDVRAAAATALGRFVYWGEIGSVESGHAEHATRALWERLHDTNEVVHVRRRALEDIAVSSDGSVSGVIENALYDTDPSMRESALYAMGRSADLKWIPHLVSELGQSDPALRFQAVNALGELEARAAVSQVINLIASETDSEVRLAALLALGSIGGTEARQALEAATEWEDEAVVEAAEQALEELLSDDGNTYEIINDILGIDDEEVEALTIEDEFYEDPLEAEVRQLLDERDEWLR